MKYLDAIMVLLMITVLVNAFNFFGFIPLQDQNNQSIITIDSPEPVDENMQPIDQESLAYKVTKFNVGQDYVNAGVQDQSQQYLQSGGDFLRGIYYFLTIFGGGTTMIAPTLTALHVPREMHMIIIIPIFFLYAIGLIQLISGRSFSSTD